jgi:hypothetical protein
MLLRAALAGKPVMVTVPSEAHSEFPEYSADASAAEIVEMKREDIARAAQHGFHAHASHDRVRLARFVARTTRRTTVNPLARRRGAGRPAGRPRAQATRSNSRSGDSPDDDRPHELTSAARRHVASALALSGAQTLATPRLEAALRLLDVLLAELEISRVVAEIEAIGVSR